MSPATGTAIEPLGRAQQRQHMTMRFLRSLALALVVVVAVSGSLTSPHPGFHGDGLGVLLGLVAVAAGFLGVLSASPPSTAAPVFFFALVVSGSLALVWLQPNGPGFVGVFLAASIAALRVRPAVGIALVVATLIALGLVGGLASHVPAWSLAFEELGVIAFVLVALLARRLREGQEQAQRLLLELQESRDAQARAAALAERQRLAREMHDVLAHSLSGLVLQLEGARLLAAQRKVDADLGEAIQRAHRLAKAGLEEARRAIGLLRDDELPGPERLPALAEAFAADTGTPCTLEVIGAEHRLSSEARLTVYRVAQEALTNVRKHSTPARVELQLSYETGGTRLTVEDFGANGHSPVDHADEGYGLTGMRERAELLGGRLTATATASGFRVDLWVPP